MGFSQFHGPSHTSLVFPSLVSISKSTNNNKARMPSRGNHLQSEGTACRRESLPTCHQAVHIQDTQRTTKIKQQKNPKPHQQCASELHRQQTWWKVCNGKSTPIPDSPWTDGTAHHQHLTVNTEGHIQGNNSAFTVFKSAYLKQSSLL